MKEPTFVDSFLFFCSFFSKKEEQLVGLVGEGEREGGKGGGGEEVGVLRELCGWVGKAENVRGVVREWERERMRS